MIIESGIIILSAFIIELDNLSKSLSSDLFFFKLKYFFPKYKAGKTLINTKIIRIVKIIKVLLLFLI